MAIQARVQGFRFSDVPVRQPETIEGSVDNNYTYLYYPLFADGFVILNKEFLHIYNLIDGKKSFKDIFNYLLNEDQTLQKDLVKFLFQELLNHRVIGIDTAFDSIYRKSITPRPRLLRVWFHITNKCNFRCIYCFVNKSEEHMLLNDALKWINEVLNQAKIEGYKKIVCNFAGGEPLLEWNNILKVVNYGVSVARKNKMEIKFGIVTNGSLITNDIARTIRDKNMIVALSCDGLNKYQNVQRQLINGTGTFKFVKRGIDCLKRNKTQFNISIVITKHNVKHIPDFTRYLLKHNIPFIFGFYKDNINSQYNMGASEQDIIKYMREVFQEIYINPPKYTLFHGLLDNIVLDNPHISPCRAGRDYLVLKNDGKIAFCPLSIEKDIGSIRNNRHLFKTIYKGSLLEPKNRSIEKVKTCSDCTWRYSCCGGCPLMTKQFKGTFNTNSPFCRVYKTLIPEILRLEANRLIIHSN